VCDPLRIATYIRVGKRKLKHTPSFKESIEIGLIFEIGAYKLISFIILVQRYRLSLPIFFFFNALKKIKAQNDYSLEFDILFVCI